MGAQASTTNTAPNTTVSDTSFGIPEAYRIERRHRLTPEEFEQEYYNKKKPVIITGILDDWPASQKWNKEYLREQIGMFSLSLWFVCLSVYLCFCCGVCGVCDVRARVRLRRQDQTYLTGGRKHTFRYGRESVQMKVSEYIDAAEKYTEAYMTAKKARQQKSSATATAATTTATTPMTAAKEATEGVFPKLPSNTDEKGRRNERVVLL